jgi:hypothetical protein
MNDYRPHRTRLLCRLVRRWEMQMGPASGESALTQRHIEQCEACQEFFSEDLAFEQNLRRGAAFVKTEPEAGMELRILQAVTATRTVRRRERFRSFLFAGVALAWTLIQRPHATESKETGIAAVEKSGKESGGLATPTSTHGWWTAWDAQHSALAMAEKNPLQEEIDSVYTDAQTAIGFLALNFLPTSEGSATAPSEKRAEPSQG